MKTERAKLLPPGLFAEKALAFAMAGFSELWAVAAGLLAIFSNSDLEAEEGVGLCILAGCSSLTEAFLLFLVKAGVANAGSSLSMSIALRLPLRVELLGANESWDMVSSALRFFEAVDLDGEGSTASSSGSGRPCSRRHLLRTSLDGLTF